MMATIWPAPYFAADETPANTLRLQASFSGVTLTGNRPGLDWKYGTLLLGEEERVWFRKADRSQLFQLVTHWGNRAPELHASAFRFHPRIDLFLEPYSKTPEFTLYFADQASAHRAHAILVKYTQLLPIPIPHLPPAAAALQGKAALAPAIRGVGFIETKQRELMRQESKLAIEAFSGDLSELQSRAKTVLDLVKKCAEEVKTTGERDAFDALLADIGLVNNPVTRENSGRRYHELLAKQITEFLLPRQAIVISLPDVFALYNRARSGGLVSPQDVQKACELMTGELEYCVFAGSGVKCLRNRNLYGGIARACDEIWAQEEGEGEFKRGIFPSDLTRKLKSLSLILAKEWLLEQEHTGALVRDVDAYGNVCWFKNLFATL